MNLEAGRWSLKRSFFNMASIGGADVCWEWLGGKTTRGYGQIQRYPEPGVKKVVYAHRVAYEMAHKTTLASDETLHHICENPSCVNPKHLVAMSQSQHQRIHLKKRWARD